MAFERWKPNGPTEKMQPLDVSVTSPQLTELAARSSSRLVTMASPIPGRYTRDNVSIGRRPADLSSSDAVPAS